MQPNIWSKAPLIRLLLPFALGIILCAYYSGISDVTYFALAAACLCLYLVSLYRKKASGLVAGSWPGIFMSLFCFFAGAALCQQNKANLHKDFFANYTNDSSILLVRIYEPLQEKENSYKGIAVVEAVTNNNKLIATEGKLLLYFKKENLTRLPKYGDLFFISNTVKLLQAPLSPEVFDYAEYMRYRQIYHSAYLQNGQFVFTGRNNSSQFWQYIYAIKEKLLAQIDYYVHGKNERGIAKALVLGDVNDIEPQITANYAGTGTLHVLSVSGLHVGLIFMVLNFFTSALTNTKTGRFIRAAILILSLGFYAVLTGLSASVLRSVVMFCFVVIGLNFRSITNIYNAMAFSALGLLLYDPFLLMQVGFQLSYIALLGIVWLFPYISKFWQPENKILKWIRDLLAMSVAAQIATFPLGLFYFNQFPTYFLLSNLVVIPWSIVVLFAGCVFLIISFIPFPEAFIAFCGKILQWLIYSLNWVVGKLLALPFSQWEGTYISIFECVLIYATISLLLFSFIYKHKYLLASGLAVLALFFSIRSVNHIRSLAENKLVVHAIPKTSLISIKENNRLYLLGDTAFTENPDQRKIYINRFAYKHFVEKPYIAAAKNASVLTQNFYYNAPFGQFGEHTFIWLNGTKPTLPTSIPSKLDFIILSKNTRLKIADLRQKVHFDKVILTADNSFYRNNSWEQECRQFGITCINLQKDNSFVINH